MERIPTVNNAAEGAAIQTASAIAPVMGHDDEAIGTDAQHVIDIAAWERTEQGHATLNHLTAPASLCPYHATCGRAQPGAIPDPAPVDVSDASRNRSQAFEALDEGAIRSDRIGAMPYVFAGA